MTESLRAYTTNKIISIGWVLIVIAASWLWLGYTENQWRLILVTIITFGYAHFLIGFYYQIRSFFRRSNPWQHVFVFLVLALLSVLLAEFLFATVGYGIGLFFGFAYFLLHGLFNEQTLLSREGGVEVPLLYICSLAVFVMTLLTYAIPDETFLFDRSLQFLPVDNFIFIQSFLEMGMKLSVFPYLFWLGVGLSATILAAAWLRYRNTPLTLWLYALYTLVIIATILFGGVPYVYMYFLVVGYHFMTWFLFYIRTMKKRSGAALRMFTILHVITLLPFVVGGWFLLQEVTSPAVLLLFDYKYFVIATYIHITTSFMNDDWFQRFQVRLLGS